MSYTPDFERVPFYRAAGVEYTYVHPREFKIPYRQRMEKMALTYMQTARDMQKVHTASYGRTYDPAFTDGYEDAMEIVHRGLFHKDPGCVEYSTPVCADWDELRMQFDYGLAVAEAHDLRLQTENVCSGMGHVNIGVTPQEAGRVLFDVQERPYLALAFCRPPELCTCPPSITQSESYRDRGYNPSIRPKESEKYLDISYQRSESRDFGDRIEFRMFSSPEDWEESAGHVALAQRYTQFASRRREGRAVSHSDFVEQITKRFYYVKDCIAEFKLFVEEMRLPWSYYGRYVPWLKLNHAKMYDELDTDLSYQRSTDFTFSLRQVHHAVKLASQNAQSRGPEDVGVPDGGIVESVHVLSGHVEQGVPAFQVPSSTTASTSPQVLSRITRRTPTQYIRHINREGWHTL